MGRLTEHTNVDIRLTLKTGSIHLLYSPSVWSKRAENFLIRLPLFGLVGFPYSCELLAEFGALNVSRGAS